MVPRVVYEFGGYRFDPVDARLVCGETFVQLTAKAADTLLALVRQPNVVVSKDDLMRAVWPDVVVDENNLNQQIAAIRKALSGNGHVVAIETVPRRGYRLPAAAPSSRPEAALARNRLSMRRVRLRLPLRPPALPFRAAACGVHGSRRRRV